MIGSPLLSHGSKNPTSFFISESFTILDTTHVCVASSPRDTSLAALKILR